MEQRHISPLGIVGAGIGLAVGALALHEVAAFRSGATWISQGGSPRGTMYGRWLGLRSVITTGIDSFIHHPKLTFTTRYAELAARRMENRLFYNGMKQTGKQLLIGYDNASDAFRHTYASALITYRLMRKYPVDASAAERMLMKVGNAHERDSWLHVFDKKHALYSGQMDVHNNHVGFAIGAQLAREHAAAGVELTRGEAALSQKVLDAIAGGTSVNLDAIRGATTPEVLADIAWRANPDGKTVTVRSVVMDHIDSAPRPGTLSDLAWGRSTDGTYRLKTGDDMPNAPGFPMPFANNRYGEPDLRYGHATLDLQTMKIPRDVVAQG